MDTIRVLLAEDHTIVRKGLRSLLEREVGIKTVGEAEDGREAIRKAEKLQPDVVVMDIAMPGLNGLEATRSIKSFRKDVIIIAQTAFAMDEDRRNCSAVGCDDFLAKPIRYKVLLDTLSKYFK